MINYDEIKDTFIAVAREAVGSRLAEIGRDGDKYPAVINRRPKGPKPPGYPYITLDILDTVQTKGWKLDTGVTDEENVYWETDYTVLMQYTVYGDEAKSIANELEGYFRIERVLDAIREDTGGAVVETFKVVSAPQSLSTQYVEASFFNLTFSIVDRVVDTQTGVFDTLILDGELFRNQDDPDPYEIEIIATSVAP